MGKSLASVPPFCNGLACGPRHLGLKAQVLKMLQNPTASPILGQHNKESSHANLCHFTSQRLEDR